MTRSFLPGKIIVRLKPGYELDQIAAHRDVRQGLAQAAAALDGGPVERTVRRRGGEFRVSRAFTTAKNVMTPGKRHLEWNALEHETGLSRTFRIGVHPLADVRALCADLADLDGVEMALPQYLCSAPDAIFEHTAGEETADDSRALIGAAQALEMEPGDPTVIVGIVDSGAQSSHPELAGRLRPGLSSVTLSELAMAAQLASGPRARQDVSDDQGHGTACAGIIGANGLDLPPGLAGKAEMLAIRALCAARMPGEARFTAVGNLADIDSGWKSCIDLGARVINLSFGTAQSMLDADDPVPHVALVRYALGRECVLVSAAGNSGEDEVIYPAALPGVIAVGSVSSARKRSVFSTGGRHLALCAPGEGVRVAALSGYGRLSGTSFAAPQVAAAAALMIARAARCSTPLSAVAVRDLLQRSAAPFAPGDPRTSHSTCGAGVLNVPAALTAVDEECEAEAA
jgi:subtilisin family serine protease